MSNNNGKMYKNNTTKKFDNTQKVYSTINKESIHESQKRKSSKFNYNIEQKIHDIFKSPTYVYKIDVVIVTDEETIEKRIIGKNKNYLITFDNEYIAIDKIRDIYLK